MEEAQVPAIYVASRLLSLGEEEDDEGKGRDRAMLGQAPPFLVLWESL